MSCLAMRVFTVSAAVAALSSLAPAQELEAGIALKSGESFLLRVAPEVQTAQAQATVDSCSWVTIEIYAVVEGLATTILGPGGQVINPQTIGGFGGEHSAEYFPERGNSPLIGPIPSDAFRESFHFPTLGPGPYTVSVDATQLFQAVPGQEHTPIFVVVSTDSDVRTAALVSSPRLPAQSAQVICVAVVNDAAAAANATVALTISRLLKN